MLKNITDSLSPKAVLIELGGSHSEVLYPQLSFLKHGGYHTTLICDPKVYDLVKNYDQVDVLLKSEIPQSGWLRQMNALWKIRNYIVQEKVKLVIFNTANGPLIRTLCLMPYPPDIIFAGILHSLHKLKGSITQSLISYRVRKYFVLAAYLKRLAYTYHRPKLSFEFFYPMFFMPPKNEHPVTKPAGEIWIAIAGGLEYGRRDYKSLAYALHKLKKKIPLKFLLLGNSSYPGGDGNDFRALISNLGVEEYFVFWNEYVSNDVFHAYLKKSDAIMPLVHPVPHIKSVYLNYQISGSWNLAYAYQLPLLMADAFAGLEDFKDYGVFYQPENLTEAIEKLPNILLSHRKLYQGDAWQFAFQANQYLRFLKS